MNADARMKLLILDNYDSFTFNLVQYLGELGAQIHVVRTNAITAATVLERARAGSIDALVLSPGPSVPEEAGITLEAIAALSGVIPILGVCLGHQAIRIRAIEIFFFFHSM